MLNAQDAEEALKDIPYPESDDKNELRLMWAVYNEEKASVLSEFREWLAKVYASNLPPSVQEMVWNQAREWSLHQGYAATEDYYAHYAKFAESVRNAE